VSAIAYLDPNVFIDALEGADSIALPIKALFEAARSKPGALVTSELTLAEVLAPSRRGGRPPDLRRRYLDLIVWGGVVDLRPVSRDVIYETVELRPYAPLKLPDAIHLATAILAGCRYLVTRDEGFRNMPAGMQRMAPEPKQLAGIVKDLSS
jgi:predicted nucleic acid-binding protein